MMESSEEDQRTFELVNNIPSASVLPHPENMEALSFSVEPQSTADNNSQTLSLEGAAFQTIEVKGNDEWSIILDVGASECSQGAAMLTGVQELTVASRSLLPQGCLLYQCDDNIYRISYPVIAATPETDNLTNGEQEIHVLKDNQEGEVGTQSMVKPMELVEGQTEKEENGGKDGTKESAATTHSCTIPGCGRQFSSLGYLKVHQLIHSCQKALVCTFEGCNRKFSWPAHLKYHMLTHLGKRPFACDVAGCGKAFYTGQRLAVHKRTHTGERPFICSVDGCGKSFTTHGNLKNHSRIHTGEKPYKCDVDGCNKGFTELSSLKKHKIVHSGRKPFLCDVCGQTFTQSGSRNVHMRKNHSTKSTVALSTTVANCQNVIESPVIDTTKLIVIPSNGDQIYQQSDITESPVTMTTTESLLMSTSANVVVLSQPEEMVAITTSYEDDNPRDKPSSSAMLQNPT